LQKCVTLQLGARLSPVLPLLGQQGIGAQRDSRLYYVSSAVVLVWCSQPRGVRPLPAFVARAQIIALARFGIRSRASPPLLPAGEFGSATSPLFVRLPSRRPPANSLGTRSAGTAGSEIIHFCPRAQTEIDGFCSERSSSLPLALLKNALCGAGPFTRRFYFLYTLSSKYSSSNSVFDRGVQLLGKVIVHVDAIVIF
jgi:hypothetical protein